MTRVGVSGGWRLKLLLSALSPFVAVWSAPADAQVALPSREEVTPPTPDAQRESSVSVDSRAAFERPPCPFEQSPLKLTVNQVRFVRPDGSPLAAPIAQALAGITVPRGEQPLSLICSLRDDANHALQSAGWVASIQVPAQQINGTLTLQVITAHMVEVRVRGDAGPYQKLLRDRIARMQAMNPLNEREIERLLLLAGDVPGLQVQLSLRPAGTEQGAVIGELTVAFRRFSVLANVENYNSRLLGPTTLYARAELYGLTGLGDLTYLGASTTTDFNEQIIAQAGHVATLDSAGTTLGGRFTYAWSKPDLGALDYRTDTLIAGIDLQRPLIRSLRLNVRARAGFEFVNQSSSVASGDTKVPLTQDKLRILYAGMDGSYTKLAADGSTAFSVSGSLDLRKGIDVFGSSDTGFAGGELTSRINGDSRALVLRGVLDTVIGLGPIFSLAGEAQGQWANEPLLNYEELSIGNLTVGRGYDPGANSGDRFIGGHGEVRANLPLLRGLSPQVFGFYDYVYLSNLDPTAIERERTFRSYGGGGRIRLWNRYALEVSYAHPQDKALLIDDRRPPDRVLVSFTAYLRDRAR
jgi:hemolysin activation/secretion protein